MNRGLTLVEVVVSAALLALVASVCVPILRDAARQREQAIEVTSAELDALGAALDAWLAEHDPEAVDMGPTEISDGTSDPLTVRRITESPDWIAAKRGDLVVLRWAPFPKELTEPEP